MLGNRYRIRNGRLPFMMIFTVGLFAGIILMNIGKSILLEDTGILDEYTLYHMKYMTVESSALFYYVLRERLGQLIVLAILSTTYLGLAVCGGMTFWYGICGGVFLSTAVMRYGVKGIFLVVVGVFPQYLVYVPVMMVMLLWCQKLYRIIYIERTEISVPRQLLQLFGIVVFVVLGCVLESFVNPYLFRGLLQIF